MRRPIVGAVLLLACAAALGAAAQSREKSFIVTVLAEPDGPVTDLTAADFIVREENTTLEVVSAELSKFPLVVSLLIDMTQPNIPDGMLMRDLRGAVASFVSTLRASQPGVRIALVEVGGGAVTTSDFDAPAATLDAAVQKLFPAHPADAIMLEAIGQAAKSLTPMQTPRRAIVAVDFNSSESQTEDTLKRMSSSLSQSGATVWSVSVRLPRSNQSRREGALNVMTKNTGGLRQVASASSGLEAMLKKVAHSLASQYVVNFARPGDAPMKTVVMETKKGHKVNVSPMRR